MQYIAAIHSNSWLMALYIVRLTNIKIRQALMSNHLATVGSKTSLLTGSRCQRCVYTLWRAMVESPQFDDVAAIVSSETEKS